jgi:hypothetical protein
MLLSKGKIIQDMIKLLDKWRHTGFNVFCEQWIFPWQKRSMENLARHIIRAPFSQERMTYHRETDQVEYRSKEGKKTRCFTHWIILLQCGHTCPTKVSRWFGTWPL